MQPLRRENDSHIRDSSGAFLQMIYGKKNLDLAAGARLGPSEIVAAEGLLAWGPGSVKAPLSRQAFVSFLYAGTQGEVVDHAGDAGKAEANVFGPRGSGASCGVVEVVS